MRVVASSLGLASVIARACEAIHYLLFRFAARWIALDDPLAMTAGYRLRDLAARSARGLHFVCPLRKQRAQGRPGARCTRGLVCNCAQKTRTRAYRFSGEHPAFPAQWLYGLLRALPGERLFCHRRPQKLASAELDASTAASGPHDFAVRVMRARLAPSRPPLPPRVRDDRERPSCGRDARSYSLDLPDGLSGIFLREGLDRFLRDLPVALLCRTDNATSSLRAKRRNR